MSLKTVDVCVVSDFLCPWCYVGGIRLDRAIQALKESGVQAKVTWHTFLIEDRIPQGGMDFGTYMDKRWGAPHPYWLNDVEQSASADNMPLLWNDIAIDTFEAHCCSEYVGKHYPEKQHEFHIALLRANYEQNLNISKREVIGQVASKCGLNGDEVANQKEFTRQDIPRLCFEFPNVHGVPDITFSQNGKVLFHYSGAQTTQWILKQLKNCKVI
ncbi:DsbA family oxidoreductase [Histomonas meleagridis]|uniref:DsbA family oxidoreductase n=1 Tax=Histomonas meleagridis TaxID=135588 RepID=UPI003559E104|nr:DsbA family oxidoreductase [Histomonas meleagridis]KAH0802787.1 DsbA family oxidoreductase [Histomonas meleagridis]